MLNESVDEMVPIAVAKKQEMLAKRRVPTLEFQEIEGDHFFILSNRKSSFDAIRKFMNME